MKRIIIPLLIIISVSCQKQSEWLDEKSSISDVIPKTLKDFQTILDNAEQLNSDYPGMPVISSDNYYVLYSIWQTREENERTAYIWADELIYPNGTSQDWNNSYRKVAYANIILEGISAIEQTATNQIVYNKIKGAGLFFRALSFFDLALEFCLPYSDKAASDLGIPLRLTGDVNEKSVRSTLKQTYDQIIADLVAAEQLLPANDNLVTRPTKAAAQALLARIFLSIADYAKAEEYALKVKSGNSNLLNFNAVSATPAFPFPKFPAINSEMIFYSSVLQYGIFNNARLLIEQSFYNQYGGNDLRRTLFFADNGANGIRFRGYYTGSSGSLFTGLATNEIYLILAECAARRGDIKTALSNLNDLLVNRWKTGSFIPLTAATSSEALQKILVERRKELPLTNTIRWQDLRRLNKEPQFATTLSRTLNGQQYTLPPNHAKYVFPIPEQELRINGIQQNPR